MVMLTEPHSSPPSFPHRLLKLHHNLTAEVRNFANDPSPNVDRTMVMYFCLAKVCEGVVCEVSAKLEEKTLGQVTSHDGREWRELQRTCRRQILLSTFDIYGAIAQEELGWGIDVDKIINIEIKCKGLEAGSELVQRCKTKRGEDKVRRLASNNRSFSCLSRIEPSHHIKSLTEQCPATFLCVAQKNYFVKILKVLEELWQDVFDNLRTNKESSSMFFSDDTKAKPIVYWMPRYNNREILALKRCEAAGREWRCSLGRTSLLYWAYSNLEAVPVDSAMKCSVARVMFELLRPIFRLMMHRDFEDTLEYQEVDFEVGQEEEGCNLLDEVSWCLKICDLGRKFLRMSYASDKLLLSSSASTVSSSSLETPSANEIDVETPSDPELDKFSLAFLENPVILKSIQLYEGIITAIILLLEMHGESKVESFDQNGNRKTIDKKKKKRKKNQGEDDGNAIVAALTEIGDLMPEDFIGDTFNLFDIDCLSKDNYFSPAVEEQDDGGSIEKRKNKETSDAQNIFMHKAIRHSLAKRELPDGAKGSSDSRSSSLLLSNVAINSTLDSLYLVGSWWRVPSSTIKTKYITSMWYHGKDMEIEDIYKDSIGTSSIDHDVLVEDGVKVVCWRLQKIIEAFRKDKVRNSRCRRSSLFSPSFFASSPSNAKPQKTLMYKKK